MVKVHVNILLDEELRDMAKARNVSISKTCNEALASRLSLPNTKEELIVRKHKLREELKVIEVKEAEVDRDEEIKSRRQVLDEMQADVKELRELWAQRNDSKISDDEWGKYVSKFCGIWKVERAVAVQYAEGRKEVRG